MGEKMIDNVMKKIIITVKENIENNLNDVIKNSTYPELTKYIKMLPKEYENDESLFYWGCSYLNEYYKIIGKLDDNTPEIEELKHKLYILYLKENYNDVVFTYDEFITFSKLLNITFGEYDLNKNRKIDKEPYKSGNKKLDVAVNIIAKNALHSPHPNSYEVTNFKLKILLNVLKNKSTNLLKDDFDKIDLDDISLNNILSQKRIKELKKKK